MAKKTSSNEGGEELVKRGRTNGKAAATETEPDEKLVNEAVAFIREAVRKTLERGFVEIGEYLLDKFFHNDTALVRSKSPFKGESFRALLEPCDTLDLPMRRTALQTISSIWVTTPTGAAALPCSTRCEDGASRPAALDEPSSLTRREGGLSDHP